MGKLNKNSVIKPVRYFYTLNAAATELGWSVDDILHLHETGRVELIAQPARTGLAVYGQSKERFDYYSVFPMEWRRYVQYDSATLYRLNDGGLAVIEMPIIEDDDYPCWGFRIQDESNGDLLDADEADTHEECEVSDLRMRREELERLQDGHEVYAPKRAGHKPLGQHDAPVSTKIVGALALMLAETHEEYIRGGRPNANQIADYCGELLKALPNGRVWGLGDTKIRTAISNGVSALNNLSENSN